MPNGNNLPSGPATKFPPPETIEVIRENRDSIDIPWRDCTNGRYWTRKQFKTPKKTSCFGQLGTTVGTIPSWRVLMNYSLFGKNWMIRLGVIYWRWLGGWLKR